MSEIGSAAWIAHWRRWVEDDTYHPHPPTRVEVAEFLRVWDELEQYKRGLEKEKKLWLNLFR